MLVTCKQLPVASPNINIVLTDTTSSQNKSTGPEERDTGDRYQAASPNTHTDQSFMNERGAAGSGGVALRYIRHLDMGLEEILMIKLDQSSSLLPTHKNQPVRLS